MESSSAPDANFPDDIQQGAGTEYRAKDSVSQTKSARAAENVQNPAKTDQNAHKSGADAASGRLFLSARRAELLTNANALVQQGIPQLVASELSTNANALVQQGIPQLVASELSTQAVNRGSLIVDRMEKNGMPNDTQFTNPDSRTGRSELRAGSKGNGNENTDRRREPRPELDARNKELLERVKSLIRRAKPEQLEALNHLIKELEAPEKLGTDWLRVTATMEEAFEFHRNWRVQDEGSFEAVIAEKNVLIERNALSKAADWFKGNPKYERVGYFQAEKAENKIHIKDFIPEPAYAHDPAFGLDLNLHRFQDKEIQTITVVMGGRLTLINHEIEQLTGLYDEKWIIGKRDKSVLWIRAHSLFSGRSDTQPGTHDFIENINGHVRLAYSIDQPAFWAYWRKKQRENIVVPVNGGMGETISLMTNKDRSELRAAKAEQRVEKITANLNKIWDDSGLWPLQALIRDYINRKTPGLGQLLMKMDPQNPAEFAGAAVELTAASIVEARIKGAHVAGFGLNLGSEKAQLLIDALVIVDRGNKAYKKAGQNWVIPGGLYLGEFKKTESIVTTIRGALAKQIPSQLRAAREFEAQIGKPISGALLFAGGNELPLEHAGIAVSHPNEAKGKPVYIMTGQMNYRASDLVAIPFPSESEIREMANEKIDTLSLMRNFAPPIETEKGSSSQPVFPDWEEMQHFYARVNEWTSFFNKTIVFDRSATIEDAERNLSWYFSQSPDIESLHQNLLRERIGQTPLERARNVWRFLQTKNVLGRPQPVRSLQQVYSDRTRVPLWIFPIAAVFSDPGLRIYPKSGHWRISQPVDITQMMMNWAKVWQMRGYSNVLVEGEPDLEVSDAVFKVRKDRYAKNFQLGTAEEAWRGTLYHAVLETLFRFAFENSGEKIEVKGFFDPENRPAQIKHVIFEVRVHNPRYRAVPDHDAAKEEIEALVWQLGGTFEIENEEDLIYRIRVPFNLPEPGSSSRSELRRPVRQAGTDADASVPQSARSVDRSKLRTELRQQSIHPHDGETIEAGERSELRAEEKKYPGSSKIYPFLKAQEAARKRGETLRSTDWDNEDKPEADHSEPPAIRPVLKLQTHARGVTHLGSPALIWFEQDLRKTHLFVYDSSAHLVYFADVNENTYEIGNWRPVLKTVLEKIEYKDRYAVKIGGEVIDEVEARDWLEEDAHDGTKIKIAYPNPLAARAVLWRAELTRELIRPATPVTEEAFGRLDGKVAVSYGLFNQKAPALISVPDLVTDTTYTTWIAVETDGRIAILQQPPSVNRHARILLGRLTEQNGKISAAWDRIPLFAGADLDKFGEKIFYQDDKPYASWLPVESGLRGSAGLVLIKGVPFTLKWRHKDAGAADVLALIEPGKIGSEDPAESGPQASFIASGYTTVEQSQFDSKNIPDARETVYTYDTAGYYSSAPLGQRLKKRLSDNNAAGPTAGKLGAVYRLDDKRSELRSKIRPQTTDHRPQTEELITESARPPDALRFTLHSSLMGRGLAGFLESGYSFVVGANVVLSGDGRQNHFDEGNVSLERTKTGFERIKSSFKRIKSLVEKLQSFSKNAEVAANSFKHDGESALLGIFRAFLQFFRHKIFPFDLSSAFRKRERNLAEGLSAVNANSGKNEESVRISHKIERIPDKNKSGVLSSAEAVDRGLSTRGVRPGNLTELMRAANLLKPGSVPSERERAEAARFVVQEVSADDLWHFAERLRSEVRRAGDEVRTKDKNLAEALQNIFPVESQKLAALASAALASTPDQKIEIALELSKAADPDSFKKAASEFRGAISRLVITGEGREAASVLQRGSEIPVTTLKSLKGMKPDTRVQGLIPVLRPDDGGYEGNPDVLAIGLNASAAAQDPAAYYAGIYGEIVKLALAVAAGVSKEKKEDFLRRFENGKRNYDGLSLETVNLLKAVLLDEFSAGAAPAVLFNSNGIVVNSAVLAAYLSLRAQESLQVSA